MPKSYTLEFRAVELCRAALLRARSPKTSGSPRRRSTAGSPKPKSTWASARGTPSGEQPELAKARSRIKELEAGLEVTRKASALFSEGRSDPPQRIYPVIVAVAGQGHSAKKCSQMLGVAASGFFYWRNRPPRMLGQRTEQLGGLITDIHPRLQRNLRHSTSDGGFQAGMRAHGQSQGRTQESQAQGPYQRRRCCRRSPTAPVYPRRP